MTAKISANNPLIGTIHAFGGPIGDTFEDDTGTLVCDGRLLDGADPIYKDLFDAIGTSWGGFGTFFNLPNLDGLFLRGINSKGKPSTFDPDSTSRTPFVLGGNMGSSVGSFQNDDIRKHSHDCSTDINSHKGVFFSSYNSHAHTDRIPTTFLPAGGDIHAPFSDGGLAGIARSKVGIGDSGGLECRPKNASVVFVIYYR